MIKYHKVECRGKTMPIPQHAACAWQRNDVDGTGLRWGTLLAGDCPAAARETSN